MRQKPRPLGIAKPLIALLFCWLLSCSTKILLRGIFMRLFLSILTVLALSTSSNAFAQRFEEDSSNKDESSSETTFDPFSDYSEFEEGGEEESDINFFHNGRFFTLGAYAGAASFTESYGQLYKPGVTYGGFLTYFFDLRFAVQVSYGGSDHTIGFVDANNGTAYRGKVNITRFEFELKYYINTQNVSRGLAKINPYLIGGFSKIYDTTTYDTASGFVRNDTTGFQGGVGIEFPMMNNRMCLGMQGKYHYVPFTEEGKNIKFTNGTTVTDTGIAPQGDLFTVTGLIGINF
jgi:hypothetical protein